MNLFNGASASAKYCGVSVRHFRRLSEQLEIQPMVFHVKHAGLRQNGARGGCGILYKWSPAQLDQIRNAVHKNQHPGKG